MIQLTTFPQGSGSPVNLDLTDDARVSFSLSFADPGRPTTRSSPYSSTFTLPFTQANDAFFGHFCEVNLLSGSFNPSLRVSCVVSTNGTPVFEGYLQLRSVSLQSRTYEVNVVGAAGDLFTTLGNTTLAELIDETAEFIANGPNVVSSWDIAEDVSGLGAGVVVVPLADYGNSLGNRLFFNAGVSDGLSHPTYLPAYKLKPAVKVDYLVRRMFQVAGYELSSSFMATADWLKLYTLIGTQDKNEAEPVTGCKVGIGSNLLFPDTTVQLINLSNQTAPFYDPNNLHDGIGFTAPWSGDAQVTVSLDIDLDGSAPVLFIAGLTKGATIVWEQFFTGGGVFTATFGVEMQAGEEFQLRLRRGQTASGGPYDYALKATTATFLLVEIPGQFINVRRAMPSVTAADYLRDLVQRFNLVVTADPDDQTRLIVEPLPDYLGSGATHDWTPKLDLASKVLLEPTTPIRNKELVFSDGVDADYFNVWHSRNLGGPLGQYAFRSQDEFATGSTTNNPVHGSFAVYPLPNSSGQSSDVPGVVIPHLYGVNEAGEAEAVTTLPKLMFYNELVEDAFPQDIWIGSQTTRDYPHFSPFSTRTLGASTWSLYWRHTHHFSLALGETYAQGLFGRFWASYMADIYADEARILTATFILDAEDIRGLDFADVVRVQSGTYRVLEIQNYNPDREGPCEVKLLKIVDPDTVTLYPSRCELTLVTQNLDGTTSWEDADEVSASPTRECCEANGFTFYDDECWWRFPFNPGTAPGGVMPGTLPSAPIDLPAVISSNVPAGGVNNTAYPFVQGSNFQATNDENTFTTGATLRALLTCTTYNDDPQVATPFGRETSELYLQPNTYAQLRIRAVGMDVSGAGYTPGDYRMVEQVTLVTNFGGIPRVPQDHEIRHYKASGLSQPRVEVSMNAGHGAASGLSSLINVSVESGDDVVTSWLVDVDMIVINVEGFQEAEEGLLCEDGQLFSFNNATLWQTEQNL